MPTRARLLLFSSLLLLAVATAAAAGHNDDPATRAARAAYEHGMKRYNLGHYREAQKFFEDAYLAKPDPVFLYNVGQCHRMLGEHEEAVASYRSYLREKPNAPNRTDVQHLIDEEGKEIERRQAEKTRNLPPQEVSPPEAGSTAAGGAAATGAPIVVPAAAAPTATTDTARTGAQAGETPPPPPPAEPLYKKWWLWSAVGAVVLAGAAVGLGVAFGRPSDPVVPPTGGGNLELGFH